jgi:hypothetical protein
MIACIGKLMALSLLTTLAAAVATRQRTRADSVRGANRAKSVAKK